MPSSPQTEERNYIMKKNLLTFIACALIFVVGFFLYKNNSYHIDNNYRYECGLCGGFMENRTALPEDFEGQCEACEAAVTMANLTLVGEPVKQSTFRYKCPTCEGIFEREHEMKPSFRGECPLCNEKITGKTAIFMKESVSRSTGYYIAAVGSYMALAGAVFGLISGINALLDGLDKIAEKINAARYAKKENKADEKATAAQ